MANKLYTNKKWLTTQYCKLKIPTADIAKSCDSNANIIRYWCRKFNLKRYRLRKGRYYDVNEDYFSKINNTEKAYWLGFIAADGCVGDKKGQKMLSIELAFKDKSHLEKLKKNIGYSGPVHDKIRTVKGELRYSCYLTICCERIVDDLFKLGIVPRKSSILKRPNIKEEFFRHWIRGYFDGDGSVSVCNGKNIIGQFFGTKDVIEFICENRPGRGSPCKKKDSKGWYCSWGGNLISKKIYDYMYKRSKVCLERKKKVFLSLSK
jgi:hypothetical protein